MRVLSLLSFFGVLAALAATTLGQSSSSSSSSSSAAMAASSSSSSSAASSAASSASSSSSASSTGSSSGASSSSRPSSSSGSSSSGMSSSVSSGSSSSSSSYMASSGAAGVSGNPALIQTYVNNSDATVVNFALTLERLDSTFWSCYLSTYSTANQPYCAYVNVPRQFNQTDFTNAGYNATVWQAVNLIAAEELAHAALLNLTTMALFPNYAPAQPCQYQYQYPPVGGAAITNVSQYLALGLQFETVGTAAYAGALNGLTNPALVQAAASIASVEARHAGYLSNLLGMQPFASSGFNDAFNSSYVASLISPFYVSQSCLAQTMLPVVRPFGVTGNPGAAPSFTGAYVNPFGVNYTNAQKFNDIATLNYALVLEDLEATFYNTASQAFTPAQYTAAGYANNVPTYLGIIAQNENTHVSVLRMVIGAYGGVPLQNCTYNFSAVMGINAFSSIQNYLTYASMLEGVGVMAYDGAANTLTDTYLLQVAATIDMIEARHVAFINTLLYATNVSAISNVTAVFPSATDSPMTPAQIYGIVTGLGIITGCQGQTIQIPGVVNPVPGFTISGAGSVVTNTTNGTTNYFPYYSSSSSSTGAGSSGASATASAQWLLIVAAASAMVALML